MNELTEMLKVPSGQLADRNASSTRAELSAAMPMKVPISFSPSPPPARSLSERNAMYGTPLA